MGQSGLYEDAVQAFGAAIERLAHSYELDVHKRQDLLQNIHLNLWRSFERFNGQCSLRTWVYRVAHNVAATHAIDERRRRSRRLVGLEELDTREVGVAPDGDRRVLLSRLMELVQRLRPLDRELVVLYLEGLNAAEIGEVMGISAGNGPIRRRSHNLPIAGIRTRVSGHPPFHRGRWLWSRIVVMFPVVPILSYGQLRADSFAIGEYVTGVLVPWMALIAFAVFIVQRGAARGYDRLLRELDDIERTSRHERFMAAHEQWKDGQEKER